MLSDKELKVVEDCMRTARHDFGIDDNHANPELFSIFPQIWGNTSMMFIKRGNQLAGQGFTTAYTVVLRVQEIYCVYCAGKFAYRIDNPNDLFFEDIKLKYLSNIMKSSDYSENRNQATAAPACHIDL